MITLTVLCQDGAEKKIEDVVSQSNDRKWCAENALFTVNGISFFPAYGIDRKPFVFVVNNGRVSNKLIYRLTDDKVIESSMSDYTYDKFKKALEDNRQLIQDTLDEVQVYA